MSRLQQEQGSCVGPGSQDEGYLQRSVLGLALKIALGVVLGVALGMALGRALGMALEVAFEEVPSVV